MSRKHFSLLLAVTLLVAAAVLLIPGKTSRDSDVQHVLLIPDLQDQVNDLDRLRVSGAGGEPIATLLRGDGSWGVEETNGYRADWNQLRTLLADLAQAEVVERKTANPDYYTRLGVEDTSAPDATGVMLEFDSASGLPALIVGNRSEGRDGHYVRLRDATESVLIDRSLEVPRDSEDWLDRNIIHIADSEVVEVEIGHPDGERVVARKSSADEENFALQNVPEGREIQSAWAVDSLANGLASLSLEAVAPADDLDWSEATRFGLVTADGLRVDAELITVETGHEDEPADTAYWIRLQAGLYQTALESGVVPPDSEDETSERAREVNRRVGGWAYRIPKYKYDGMTKRLDDLLKASEGPEA
jgi:hypothetical protein